MYRKEFTMNKKWCRQNFWCRQQSTLGVLIKSTIPPSGGFHTRRGYHSEIFGDAECEIIHFVNYEIFCLRRKWNKIRSSMCEAHFTLRSNISLPKAISLVPKERISLKNRLQCKRFFNGSPCWTRTNDRGGVLKPLLILRSAPCETAGRFCCPFIIESWHQKEWRQ